MWNMKKKKKKILLETEQIGDWQRQWGRWGVVNEDGQQVQTSSYKISKSWGCRVHQGYYV